MVRVKSYSTCSKETLAVCGAGFASQPRQLRAADFGKSLPMREEFRQGANGIRQGILLDTLSGLEEASTQAHYHRLAALNIKEWKQRAPVRETSKRCEVLVLPGDWGQVTLDMTKRYGETFAVLNMANAYSPGGGYTGGSVAQEENMFRRSDCHFSINRTTDMNPQTQRYLSDVSDLLNGKHGYVYLDMVHPRVCIRGPEDRSRDDLGYPWLPDQEVFPFFELRAAAVDLRGGKQFDPVETERRIAAQLDTCITYGQRHIVLSAFGCGAFENPASEVAAIYRDQLKPRLQHFDVVAFGIFHAGYGPNNFQPFADALSELVRLSARL